MKGFIHSIESFGTVDGPGVRFVVFFQGCPMRCQYCHNPDTWAFGGGAELEASEIISKMVRNLPFYETGGITATGGEPLAQIDFLTELFRLAKGKGIHTALDTSGITFSQEKEDKFKELIKYCDLVMLDIKHIDEEKHKLITGHSGKNPRLFLSFLQKNNVPTWIRYVLVPTLTDDEGDLIHLGELLREYDNIEKIDVLPYHNLGVMKYENLGDEYPLKHISPATKSQANEALDIINKARAK